jgi:hypothetical protein
MPVLSVSKSFYVEEQLIPLLSTLGMSSTLKGLNINSRQLQCNGISYNPERIELHGRHTNSSTLSGLREDLSLSSTGCTRGYSRLKPFRLLLILSLS